MRKIIVSIIAFLITFCLTTGLNAQSSQLDQAELMKKFIGTWKYEHDKDTIVLWTFFPSPISEGYEFIHNWKSGGESIWVTKGIAGFTAKNLKINWFLLHPDGVPGRYLGEFVSEDKLVMEVYNFDHTRIFKKDEVNFLNPDKFKYIRRQRGEDGTWDNPRVEWEAIYTRVRE